MHRIKTSLVCLAIVVTVCAGCLIGRYSAERHVPAERKVATAEAPDVSDMGAKETASAGGTAQTEDTETRTGPEFGNMYSEAVRAYREYLLNRRSVVGYGAYSLQISRLIAFGHSGEFVLIDMDDDGIPELHLKTGDHYYIFGYENEGVFLWEDAMSNTELLHNRALYTKPWNKEEGNFWYAEYDHDGGRKYTFKVKGESGRLYIDGSALWAYGINDNLKDATKAEIDKISAPYTEFAKNRDMIPWTDYKEWVENRKDEYIPFGKLASGRRYSLIEDMDVETVHGEEKPQ
jgi:hypothetical protein